MRHDGYARLYEPVHGEDEYGEATFEHAPLEGYVFASRHHNISNGNWVRTADCAAAIGSGAERGSKRLSLEEEMRAVLRAKAQRKEWKTANRFVANPHLTPRPAEEAEANADESKEAAAG